jgi:hypothetical protein
MEERIPKTISSKLSGIIKLIYRKEPVEAKWEVNNYVRQNKSIYSQDVYVVDQ